MRGASNRAKAAITTLALGVVAVVVAIAARAPLSGSTPVDATALQTPTAAVFTLIAGIGIVLLGPVAILVWSGRRRKDDPPEHEPPPVEVHWIWQVLAILLPLALGAALVVAAVTGSRLRGKEPGSGSTFLTGGSGASSGPTRAARGFVVPSWLPWTALGIIAVAVIAGIVVLWVRRPRRESTTPEAGATRVAVDAAIDALDSEADPRRAVIAAYRAMQRALGEHGVARRPTEAPREYLQRVLVASQANEREAKTLTGLFEEARYSTHPIPERFRELALTALQSLRGRLRSEGAR
jgi:heme/copper-type cytochrome/quinol oxidase subunit 2